MVEEYKELETELLRWDFEKRNNARKAGFILFDVMEHLKLLKYNESEYTLEMAIEDLNKANELLKPVMKKI